MTTSPECERVREDLEALHYDDLPSEERAAVERHLGGCAPCRAALEAVRETAGSLDQVVPPEPSELDWARFGAKLEARVGPLRTARVVQGYGRWARLGRVAAAFLIGGLAALSGGFYVQMRGLRAELDQQRLELAEQSWRSGDVHRYPTLVRAPEMQEDPVVKDRLRAVEMVEGEELPRLWQIARREVGEQEMRDRMAEVLALFPKHALADQAFIALQRTGVPTPPPLERALVHPIPLVGKALPNEAADAAPRATVAKLRAAATAPGADPRVAGWALLKAAEIAEAELSDRSLARDLCGEALRIAPAGPIREQAAEKLGKLEER